VSADRQNERADVANLLDRMNRHAATDASDAGWHAASSRYEQDAAQARDQAARTE
jgi:hypothetical protein